MYVDDVLLASNVMVDFEAKVRVTNLGEASVFLGAFPDHPDPGIHYTKPNDLMPRQTALILTAFWHAKLHKSATFRAGK